MRFSGAVQHIQIDKIIRILQDALILVALDIHSFVLVVGLYNMMIVRILGLLGHFLMFRTAMLFMMFSLVILNHLLYSNAEKKSHWYCA